MNQIRYSRSPEALFLPQNANRYIMSNGRQNPADRLHTSGSTLAASTSMTNWNNLREPMDNEGSLSSGHGSSYCDNGINVAILILTLAGLAAMFYVLYTKITMLVGRRRRSALEYNTPVQQPPYIYTYNMEDIISEIYWGRIFETISSHHKLK